MSGGSYDYLCVRDTDDLFERNQLETLERMRDRLLALGYLDAAGQTDALIGTITQARALIDMRRAALERVWHAVEWYDSGDCNEDRVAAAITEYRKQPPST